MGKRDRAQGEGQLTASRDGPTISCSAGRSGKARDALLLQPKLTNETNCSEKRKCEKMTF